MTETDKNKLKADISFTQNRELSWLKFNKRVLEEANDDTVPLFEKLKFVSIFTSNLDEFFMIRVGSLLDMALINDDHIDNKSGMTADEQLREIFRAVPALYEKKDRIFFRLEQQLARYGIERLFPEKLKDGELKFTKEYFETYILPVLSPQIIDTHHPFPHLENKSINIVVTLKTKSESRFGIIPVPKSVPRMVFLPDEMKFLLLEDIIICFAEKIFEMYHIAEKSVISVTRNADINPDDEAFGFEEDYRLHMKKVLKKRARLSSVRLEIQGGAGVPITEYLCEKLMIKRNQMFRCDSPLDMSYVYSLEEKIPASTKSRITYRPFEPCIPSTVNMNESILRQALRKDMLLNYPYESMEPLLRLVKDSANSTAVVSIKITLYRIDKKSKLAEYLIDAAERGKDITVIMELRARFDEQNNIEWAERLQEAGCKVIYGFEGFKVHSKICLITLREKNRFRYVTQIGTGNYNEKTAKLYSDFSLITANEELCGDANSFFKNMQLSNLSGRYRYMLVAPSGLKPSITALIDEEIEKVRSGREGAIIFKLNSLTDRDIIDKLSQASGAGVEIKLIIRGICCITPGIQGKTENISVISIVGRYLEHARVYCFGKGENARVYISSADMMTRNTERRVEIACPVLDNNIKSRILSMLKIQLSDTAKARELLPDGSYASRALPSVGRLNSQEYFMEEAVKNSEAPQPAKKGAWETLRRFISRVPGSSGAPENF